MLDACRLPKDRLVKILIYSHAFAPQVGGIETFSMHLARGLARPERDASVARFEVIVVTETAGASEQGLSEEPFQIVRRPSAWRLWQLVGNADKILLAGPAILPLLFALVRRKQTIVTHHGYQSICPNGMLFHFPTNRNCPGHFAAGRYMECVKCNFAQERFGSLRSLVLTFVRRALARLANSNVAVSEHVSRRIALPKSMVIRNGVQDAPLRTQPVNGCQQDPVCFAYLGRLVTEKGMPVLIEAAKILKARGRRFQILIIGDGPEREALQGQVTSLNVDRDVFFLGFQRGAPLDELMKKISVLVMPSICEDAAPFSVLEQMMQGRLIIGSMLGGLAEEIGDSGLTFTAGDALALAEQMERVIEQPQLIASLGKKARERALLIYTLERMICEYRIVLNAGQ
jgi:glycogen synthase